MKSILITGLGFLATNVAYYLSQNYKVTVTYRNLNPVKEVYVKTLKEKGVEVIQLDVLKDMDKLNNAVKEHDLVEIVALIEINRGPVGVTQVIYRGIYHVT